MSNVPVTQVGSVKSAFSNATMTKEQIEIIKNQIAVGISDQDLMYCLEIAKEAGLNPILKDIYFVPRRTNIASFGQPANWVTKHEPMIGRKGARTIARRKGMIVPPSTGHELKKIPVFSMKNGKVEWHEEMDLVGWAELEINGQTVRKEAAFSVYKQTTKQGEITKFYATMPTVMVEKVAEFQLLDAVYGLDGILSIDSGILEDTTSNEYIESNVLFDENMAKSVKDLGLEYSIENGIATLKGDVFNNAKTLNELGFTVKNSKYIMESSLRETEEKAKTNEVNEVEDINPAKEMMNLLKDAGLENGEIKDFVENVLKTNSKDTITLQKYLEDKGALSQMVSDYFAAKQEIDTNQDELDF